MRLFGLIDVCGLVLSCLESAVDVGEYWTEIGQRGPEGTFGMDTNDWLFAGHKDGKVHGATDSFEIGATVETDEHGIDGAVSLSNTGWDGEWIFGDNKEHGEYDGDNGWLLLVVFVGEWSLNGQNGFGCWINVSMVWSISSLISELLLSNEYPTWCRANDDSGARYAKLGTTEGIKSISSSSIES